MFAAKKKPESVSQEKKESSVTPGVPPPKPGGCHATDLKIHATWGSKGSGDGQLDHPWDIAVDPKGNLVVIQSGYYRAQIFTPEGQFIRKIPLNNKPRRVAVDGSNRIFITDEKDFIQVFAGDSGEHLRSIGGYGERDGQLSQPEGIAVDHEGHLMVVDTMNHRIQRFTAEGRFLSKFGREGTGNDEFHQPDQLAVDSQGNIYVTQPGHNHIVRVFSPSGSFLRSAGVTRGFPRGIALDAYDNLLLVSVDPDVLKVYHHNGNELCTLGGQRGTGQGQFDFPWGVAVDTAGHIFVADRDNDRIQVFH